MRLARLAPFLVIVTIVLLPAGRLPAAVIYGVTPLTAPGGTFQPREINDHREVVGNVTIANVGHVPVLWLPQAKYGLAAGANELSKQSGYDQDLALGINNHGQIVGTGHASPQLGSQRPT